MTSLTETTSIVRHFDGMLSIYRGVPHLGQIYPPVHDRPGFLVMFSAPFCDFHDDRSFPTEQEAIEYLSAARKG
jgi:hypothetical protein